MSSKTLVTVAAAAAGMAAGYLLKSCAATCATASPEKESDDELKDRITQEFLTEQVDRRGVNLLNSHSLYFEDVKNYKLIMTSDEIQAAVRRMADTINRNFVGKKIVLCGILKGAYVFMADLAKKLNRPYSIYFVEASSYSGQHQSDSVELLSKIVPSKFEDRHIILVDELLDNGETMRTMTEHLIDELKITRKDITTCCLFSKDNPRRPDGENADLVGVDKIPNLWLVGYGLDDNGTKRAWPHLFAKEKSAGIPKSECDIIFDNTPAGQKMLAQLRKSVREGSVVL